MQEFMKSGIKYFNIKLILHILKNAEKVTSASESSSLLDLVNIQVNPNFKPKYPFILLSSNVRLCINIRRLFRCKDTCLIRSILLCRILREHGIDGKINFGTQKKENSAQPGWSTEGHCWVTVDAQEKDHGYPFTFQYPCPGYFRPVR